MDYYRTNIAGGVVQTNPVEAYNTILNSASDSYASNYWSVPYTDGISPMKQIEGQFSVWESISCPFSNYWKY